MQTQWTLQAKANGSGVATVSLPQLALGKRWKVEQISVSTLSVQQTVCLVFLNNLFVCGTNSGNMDTAAGSPSIVITGKDTFALKWTGADVGAQCSAIIFYDDGTD